MLKCSVESFSCCCFSTFEQQEQHRKNTVTHTNTRFRAYLRYLVLFLNIFISHGWKISLDYTHTHTHTSQVYMYIHFISIVCAPQRGKEMKDREKGGRAGGMKE